jgi:hypothetical protein
MLEVMYLQLRVIPIKSGGGDFKVCLKNDSKVGYYALWGEDDFDPDQTG